MAKPMPMKPMSPKPTQPKPMPQPMPTRPSPKPAMPQPERKGWCCSTGVSVEKIQWILLIGAIFAFAVIVIFQQRTLDMLTTRINKSIESNDYAIAALDKRVIENVLKPGGMMEDGEGMMGETGMVAAPQNVGVPGSRMTVSLSGGRDWTVKTGNDAAAMMPGSALYAASGSLLRMTAMTAAISGDDLQAWFKQNARAYEPSGRASVGPNQVLVGGKLAIDETFETPNDLSGMTVTRLVYVRDGGSVVVLKMEDDGGTQSAVWDSVLNSASFAQ